MIDSVLFVGWDRPLPGRETKAVELFNQFIAFLAKNQQQGNIDSFEPVFLNVHGGDLNGFTLVRGDKNKLSTLRHSNEFLEITTKVDINVSGFGVVDGFTGEGVQTQMARYTNALK